MAFEIERHPPPTVSKRSHHILLEALQQNLLERIAQASSRIGSVGERRRHHLDLSIITEIEACQFGCPKHPKAPVPTGRDPQVVSMAHQLGPPSPRYAISVMFLFRHICRAPLGSLAHMRSRDIPKEPRRTHFRFCKPLSYTSRRIWLTESMNASRCNFWFFRGLYA